MDEFAEKRNEPSKLAFRYLSEDLVETADTFLANYAVPDLHLDPLANGSVFSWERAHVGDDDWSFRRSVVKGRASGTMAPIRGGMAVNMITHGAKTVIDQRGRTSGGAAVFLAPLDQEHRFEIDHAYIHQVHFSWSLLNRLAEEHPGGQLLRIDRLLPRTQQLETGWSRAVAEAHRALDRVRDSDDVFLLRANWGHELGTRFLDAFGHLTRSVKVVAAGSVTVTLALDFMHANVHVVTSVTEIAAAAGVTPRALQLAFKKRLSTTPMRALRLMRLEQARGELIQRDRSVTIAETAQRWGYSSPSRFAAHYASRFNELPSDTRGVVVHRDSAGH